MYKPPSVHMIKINQEKGTILGNETGYFYSGSSLRTESEHHDICSTVVLLVLGYDRTPHLPSLRMPHWLSGRHGGECSMIHAFKRHTVFTIR